MTNLLPALIAALLLQPTPADKPKDAPATTEPAPTTKPADQPAEKQANEKPAEPMIPAGAIAEYVDLSTRAEYATGFRFAEGPLWMGDRLLVCDLGGDAMYTIQPGKEKEVYRQPSDSAAGAARDMKGRLYVTHFRGKLTRQEKGKEAEVVAEACGDVKFNRLNDVAIRSDGVVYFTDFGGPDGSKGLFMYKEGKDGKGAVTLLDADYAQANGVCLSPSENVLYVAEMGKNRIKSYTIKPDGTLSDSRVFADLSSYKARGRTDGLKCDPVGNVWTTGPGGVFILGGLGDVLGHLAVSPAPSNLAFGGPEGHTLFITAGTKVLSFTILPRDGGEESGR
jgi:gluconolactonase